jgi:hypothetical protein
VKVDAAYEAQYMLYDFSDTSRNVAGAYMNMYSKVGFSAFNPGLRGVVNASGFGSNNMWTYLNMHWEPCCEKTEGGQSVVTWSLSDEPESFNPCCAHTKPAWDILDRIYDPLIAVNPYSMDDEPWLADSWNVQLFSGITPPGSSDPGISITDGMTITFSLNDTATWQDGKAFTAEDVQFNWLFLRDNTIPRYTAAWEHLISVEVVTSGQGGTVKAYLDVTGQFYLYDLSGIAALLHPTVWAPWDGHPLADILAYDPASEAGHNGQTPTNLIGTGPFVFDHYDPVGQAAGLTAHRNYWKTTEEIHAQLVEMFWACGDVNRDGIVDQVDHDRYEAAYGTEPPSDPDADLNGDGRVNGEDGALIAFWLGTPREVPYPPRLAPFMVTTLSMSEGHLGDIVHVRIVLKSPAGHIVTVVDTLPTGFSYLKQTFKLDGVAANPEAEKQRITYTVKAPCCHVLEFDVKVVKAAWEDLTIYNLATATWYVEGEMVDEKEDTDHFTIHPFDELRKSVTRDPVYLYVDGYTEWLEWDWTNPGASVVGMPDDDYAESIVNGAMSSNYTFEDIALGSTERISRVTLEGYCQYPNGPTEAVDIDIYSVEPELFAWLGSLYGGIDWAWVTPRWIEKDVSDVLPALLGSDPGPLNSLSVLLYNYEGDATNPIRIDSLRLRVEFDLLTTKVSTETQWPVVIELTNPFGYTMTKVMITDEFGAEIEVDEPFPVSITHGSVKYKAKGRTAKVSLKWKVGDLLPGETARLTILVSTDINPEREQEYTDPGIYTLNSGALLTFTDPDTNMELGAQMAALYVTVLPFEDP